MSKKTIKTNDKKEKVLDTSGFSFTPKKLLQDERLVAKAISSNPDSLKTKKRVLKKVDKVQKGKNKGGGTDLYQ